MYSPWQSLDGRLGWRSPVRAGFFTDIFHWRLKWGDISTLWTWEVTPPGSEKCEMSSPLFVWPQSLILSLSSLHLPPRRLHSQCFWSSSGGSGQASGLQPGSGSIYLHVLQQAGHHHWQGQASQHRWQVNPQHQLDSTSCTFHIMSLLSDPDHRSREMQTRAPVKFLERLQHIALSD